MVFIAADLEGGFNEEKNQSGGGYVYVSASRQRGHGVRQVMWQSGGSRSPCSRVSVYIGRIPPTTWEHSAGEGIRHPSVACVRMAAAVDDTPTAPPTQAGREKGYGGRIKHQKKHVAEADVLIAVLGSVVCCACGDPPPLPLVM